MQVFFRYGKLISLICGFLFTVIGATWSLLVVDRLSAELQQLTDARVNLTRQLQDLNSFEYQYFIANQQGDLIFILAQNEGARQDLAKLIYEGNMLDRATPVRNMIAALATANLLDYRQTYDSYEKLNNETRANFSFATFTELKMTEQEIITKGQEYAALLPNRLLEIEQAIQANEAAQGKARVIGVIFSIFGSFLLLCANLIAEQQRLRGDFSPGRSTKKSENKTKT